MHTIGIISDTHDILRPEVKEYLQDCELILHAGDITSEKVLTELAAIAPVLAVRGNGDREWAEEIPLWRKVDVFGLTVYMTHKKKDIPASLPEVDLVIFGHSHKYEDTEKDGLRFLNPGSCGPRRWNQAITMAKMQVEEGKISTVRKIDIPNERPAPMLKDQELLADDPGKLVEQVVKELEKGVSSDKIARKFMISDALVETISRMYFTHPGVDTEGILRRMGL